MEMNKLHCCKVISQSYWSLPLMDNKPKKSDFVHQTVSRGEAHGLGMSLIETAHSVKMEPLQNHGSIFYDCLCYIKRRQVSQPVSTKPSFYSQQRQLLCALNVMTKPTHFSPTSHPPPTFCSTKLISKTN